MPADSPKRILPITWGQVDQMLDIVLAGMHAKDHGFDTVIAIGGGGIIPASMLVYKYAKQIGKSIAIHPIWARSYKGQEQGSLRVDWPLPLEEMRRRWDQGSTLIVDDICDTGRTLQTFTHTFPKAATLVLVNKVPLLPDFAGTIDDSQEFWYQFPWETT